MPLLYTTNIWVPYVDIIGLFHSSQFYDKSMWCSVNVCDVAALLFQAHSN